MAGSTRGSRRATRSSISSFSSLSLRRTAILPILQWPVGRAANGVRLLAAIKTSARAPTRVNSRNATQTRRHRLRSSLMPKETIHTDKAPAAIGPYSQAIRAGNTVYLSGQLGLDPATGNLREGVEAQTRQVLDNLQAVAVAAGGSLDDIVKLTLLLVDMGDFAKVNEIMATRFKQPFPARATYQVAALPKAGRIEVEAVLVLQSP